MPLPSDRIGSPAAGASPSIPMIPGHCRPETATRDATRRDAPVLVGSVPSRPPAGLLKPTPHPRPRAYSSRFQASSRRRDHIPTRWLSFYASSCKRKQNKKKKLVLSTLDVGKRSERGGRGDVGLPRRRHARRRPRSSLSDTNESSRSRRPLCPHERPERALPG